jgi:hypothetical protein
MSLTRTSSLSPTVVVMATEDNEGEVDIDEGAEEERKALRRKQER